MSVCLTAAPPPQYQSRGLVKAPGKSSFTMFVDLGVYQPGGSGDTIPITGEDGRRCGSRPGGGYRLAAGGVAFLSCRARRGAGGA